MLSVVEVQCRGRLLSHHVLVGQSQEDLDIGDGREVVLVVRSCHMIVSGLILSFTLSVSSQSIHSCRVDYCFPCWTLEVVAAHMCEEIVMKTSWGWGSWS